MLAADFGDASSYPTILVGDAARHEATGPTLGTIGDTERDGTHSGNGRDGPTLNASPELGVTETEKTSELLQFTAGGHVLGFASDSVYVATGSHALHVEFVGAQEVSPQANADGKAQQGQAGALSHVSYVGLWEGISLSYDAVAGGIAETTYVLDPGADPGQIRLQYNVPVEIDEAGELAMSFESGCMTESAPVAWQDIEGRRSAVDVSYYRTGDQQLSFALGRYDAAYPLTVDPILTWHTFLGGSGGDRAYAIAVDGSGNVYVGGYSGDTWGWPVRAHQGNQGNWDAFAAKLSSNGSLTWNSFLGGRGTDQADGIAVDGSGNVYVGGWSTAAWGSPVRGFRASTSDAFAAKLASDGSLTWNTFLGGGGEDEADGIAVDDSGSVYVGGWSTAAWGSPVRAYTSTSDGFAAKLASDGSLTWNTFLGGGGNDRGQAIALDDSGNVYVGGWSDATWGSPVRAYVSGVDAFAAKLSNDGSLTWHSFLGGGGDDQGQAIALDGSGNVYLGGWSDATWGSPVRAHTSFYDVFAAKLSSDGSLTWNTFLGGRQPDRAYGIAVDGSGNVYVGGWSAATWGSPVRPYTSGDSPYDAFAAKLSSDGSLTWHTFLGGSGDDRGSPIAVDGSGNVYVGGSTYDVSWGSPVTLHKGNWDAFVVRFVREGSITVTPTSGLSTTEAGDAATFTISLDSEPTADVTIDLGSTDTAEGTVSPTTVTFTPSNWNIAQTVTVTGVDDDVDDGDVGYTIQTAAAISSDVSYNGLNAADVSVTNQDDDVAGISVSRISGPTTEAGGAATLTLVLDTEPAADVTIDLTSSDLTEGTISPASATFTPANWSTAQTMTVTGVDDDVDDGDVRYTIQTAEASSADANYAGLDPEDVLLTNQDDDTARISVSAISGDTTEVGGMAAFTIVLASEPTADVTIELSSNDEGEGTINRSDVKFTTDNWYVPQIVFVTGVNDKVVDGDVAYTIETAGATSDDSNYDALDAADITLSNLDDDVAGFTVTESAGCARVAESGTTDTFTVVLDAEPLSDVVISVTSGDANEMTVDESSLTFTPATWDDAQTVTVAGVDDFVVDGDQTSSVTLSVDAPNSDDAFDSLAQQTVSVTTVDDGYHGWQNRRNPYDVNGRDGVTPEDVLILVLYINSHVGDTSLPASPETAPPFYDVNDDGICSPADVLAVIAYVNSRPAQPAQGEVGSLLRPTFSFDAPSSTHLPDQSASLALLATAPTPTHLPVRVHTQTGHARSAALWATASAVEDDTSGHAHTAQRSFHDRLWDDAAAEGFDTALADLETFLPDLVAGLV